MGWAKLKPSLKLGGFKSNKIISFLFTKKICGNIDNVIIASEQCDHITMQKSMIKGTERKNNCIGTRLKLCLMNAQACIST